MNKSQQNLKPGTKTSSSKPSSKTKSPSKRKARHQIFKAFVLTALVFSVVLAVELFIKFLEGKPENTSENTQLTKTEAISKSQSESTPKSKEKEIETKKDEGKSITFFYLINLIKESAFLGQVQNFAVLVAAFLYLFEVSERKKQMERQAWQLIDGARGSETSGGRYQAIMDLYEEDKKTLLKGLDVDGADLIGINLKGANLERANLKGALLTCANLQEINLRRAKLQGANLQGANLQKADLLGAHLEGADLREYEPDTDPNSRKVPLEKRITNLEGADLGKAHLQKAILNNANLRGTNLRGANLTGAGLGGADVKGADFSEANIQGAIFSDVKNLEIDQIKNANNYHKAKYDEKFCSENPNEKLIKHEALKEDTKPITKEEIILQLLQQMQELLKLTENGDLSQDDSKVKEFIANFHSLEKIILKDPSITSDCQVEIAEKSRKLIFQLEQAFTDREKSSQKIKEYKTNPNMLSSEIEKRPDNLLSQWLKDETNITWLREQGISYFLDANNQNDLTIYQLDLQENLLQLKQDIDECLRLIREDDELEDEKINFSFPFDIYHGIFQVILAQVIPELEESKPNEFTDQMSLRLKSDCIIFIENLKRKLDPAT